MAWLYHTTHLHIHILLRNITYSPYIRTHYKTHAISLSTFPSPSSQYTIHSHIPRHTGAIRDITHVASSRRLWSHDTFFLRSTRLRDCADGDIYTRILAFIWSAPRRPIKCVLYVYVFIYIHLTLRLNRVRFADVEFATAISVTNYMR